MRLGCARCQSGAARNSRISGTLPHNDKLLSSPGNDFADSIIPLKGSCYLGNGSFVASTCACCGRACCIHTRGAKGDE